MMFSLVDIQNALAVSTTIAFFIAFFFRSLRHPPVTFGMAFVFLLAFGGVFFIRSAFGLNRGD